MLTRPIPQDAMPVVTILRRDVERPKDLPEALGLNGRGLRWVDDSETCPMGFHDQSTFWLPDDCTEFAGGICSNDSVGEFSDWWDMQTDPQAAVNAVWGEE